MYVEFYRVSIQIQSKFLIFGTKWWRFSFLITYIYAYKF